MISPNGIFPNGTVAHARVRLSKRLMWGAYGAVLATVAIFATALTPVRDMGSLLSAGVLALLAAFALTLASYIVWFRRGPRAGQVELDEAALRVQGIAGRLEVPRAEILSAAIVERPLGSTMIPYVEVDLVSGDRLSIGVPAGEDVARAMVDDLGFGPGKRRVRFDLASPARRLFHPLLGYGAYQLLTIPLAIVASVADVAFLQVLAYPLTIVAYVVTRRALRAPIVTIGDDGLLWESGWRRRFVPLRDIVEVEQLHQTMPVTIQLRSGGALRLAGAAVDLQRSSAAGRALRERLARRAPDTVAAAGSAEASPADRAAHYGRGERTVADWRAALAAMLAASYRGPTASVEDMTAVLASPLASPEERVGAALALRIAGEPPVKIRVAAESVVSEPLREALAAAAEDDDAALEGVLRRLSVEGGARR
jgi:hypothetical protein